MRETLRGQRVLLRPALPADLDPLAAILTSGPVARWWPNYDRQRVEADFLSAGPDERIYVVEVDGRPAGAILASEEPEPEFRHASIDLFLDPALHGQGLGPDAIRTVAAELIDADGHHRLTIDPAADNAVAIRAYEKVGFRPVGRLRRYQRMADGTWADGLLMEMLADELVR